MTKKKKASKKADKRTPGQKGADTRRKMRDDAMARKLGAVEKSPVTVTPYPRAGDNPEFEGVLDRVALEKESSPASKPATMPATQSQPDKPAVGGEILSIADVAEWVAWPFMLWAQMNDLASLALSTKEAKSVAEPLTSILNRHGASRVLPPDVVDGLKASARLTPILGDRFEAIKKEKDRRANAGEPTPTNVASGPVGKKVDQGAAATKPREV
ncbi:hypothetical protein LCGC14_0829100 [marine sediment metagenome]|uniref:Uncharacterized protein n=1 Tax=marine sediment metagenome TaxID=412755 RepID=A0A0F9PL71_9ZZZZ